MKNPMTAHVIRIGMSEKNNRAIGRTTPAIENLNQDEKGLIYICPINIVITHTINMFSKSFLFQGKIPPHLNKIIILTYFNIKSSVLI